MKRIILIKEDIDRGFLGGLSVEGASVLMRSLGEESRLKLSRALGEIAKPPRLIEEEWEGRERKYVLAPVPEADPRYPAAIASELTRRGLVAFMLDEKQAETFDALFDLPIPAQEKAGLLGTLPWWGEKEIEVIRGELAATQKALGLVERKKQERLAKLRQKALEDWGKAVQRERERLKAIIAKRASK